MTFQDTPLVLSLKGGPPGAQKQSLPSRPVQRMEKWASAIKLLAVTWILAGMAMAVPQTREWLVPGLLLLGPFVAGLGFRDGVVFGAGTLICPGCQSPMPVTPGLRGWPLRLFCTACGSPVDGRPA